MKADRLYEGFKLADRWVTPHNGQILTPDGFRNHVGPKAMDILVCLARYPGITVARHTLSAEAWGDATHSGDALTHHISELRHALGDDPSNPRFLQTVPRRGYCLIAKIEPLESPDDVSDATDDSVSGGFFVRQINDLKKRNVFQVVAGYPVFAWLLVQIVDVLWEYFLQPLGAPTWLVPSFVVLLAVGYPIAVFLAWAVDITPEGVQRTKGPQYTTPYLSLGVLGIGSVAIAAAAVFLFFNAYEVPEPQPDKGQANISTVVPPQDSVAVLRFENIGDRQEGGYLGDGLTEELIHELANLKTIKVASRTSVWPLSTSQLTVQEIAERLNVERILEGSVRSDGDNVRVTAQLIDKDGFHVWSHAYDRKLEDILDIQKDIAALVVKEMNVPLTKESRARLSAAPTLNTEAFDLYLQGRQFLRKPATAENLDAALALFDKAIEIDHRFSLAYAGRCEAELAQFRRTRDTHFFTLAEIACHRALTLDGGLAEVYTALGNLYRHSGQIEKAYQEYMTALSINPSLEAAHYGVGRVYQAQGNLEAAEEELRMTVMLEPGFYGTHLGLGNFLTRFGRHAEALPYYETVTQLAPEYSGGFINLGTSLFWLGQFEAAEEAWAKALEMSPHAMGYQNMGTLYYYSHRFDDAAEMHERALETAPNDHRHWGKLAAAQRYLSGQQAASQASYEKAMELVRERLTINPDDAEDLSLLAAYLVNTGKPDEAQLTVERARELAPDDPRTYYFSALVAIRTGDTTSAMAFLETAINKGYSAHLISVDPQFESLSEHTEFKSILAKTEEERGAPGP